MDIKISILDVCCITGILVYETAAEQELLWRTVTVLSFKLLSGDLGSFSLYN